METTTDLSTQAWDTAHKLANRLTKKKIPLSELSKVISYLRTYEHEKDAATKFEKYLRTLVNSGRQIAHGRNAVEYYQTIESACKEFLLGQTNDASTILQILGWTSRLMRYYEVTPIGENQEPIASSHTSNDPPKTSGNSPVTPSPTVTHQFKEGEIIEAIVTKVKGMDITYQIRETIKLTMTERKLTKSLTEGEKVKVKVIELKPNGGLKKVAYSEG